MFLYKTILLQNEKEYKVLQTEIWPWKANVFLLQQCCLSWFHAGVGDTTPKCPTQLEYSDILLVFMSPGTSSCSSWTWKMLHLSARHPKMVIRERFASPPYLPIVWGTFGDPLGFISGLEWGNTRESVTDNKNNRHDTWNHESGSKIGREGGREEETGMLRCCKVLPQKAEKTYTFFFLHIHTPGRFWGWQGYLSPAMLD